MKCVQEIKTNHITRVKNEQAECLVKSGTHTYVCKAAWKEAVRQDYVARKFEGYPEVNHTKKSKNKTPHAYRKYGGVVCERRAARSPF